MATIADVARAAGVSRTAVSFAFNDARQLAPATAQRILEVAEALGYYPNAAARTLTSKRVGALGLLTPQRSATIFANPFFGEFLRGLGEVCDSQGFSLLLVPPIAGSLRQAVNAAAVDGYVVLGLDRAHDEVGLLARRRIPFVLVDGDPLADTLAVNVEDEEGAAAAADHLLAVGHRDVLVLGIQPAEGATAEGALVSAVARRRLRGYTRAFADHGLALAPEAVLSCESTLEGGAAAFSAAWSAGQRPSAVLAMSDAIALGVLSGVRAAGLQAPDDLEVIGFDDIPAASLSCPALSTVRQPSSDKGRQAGCLLLMALAGQTPPQFQIVLPTHLVLRGSTRAPGLSPGGGAPLLE